MTGPWPTMLIVKKNGFERHVTAVQFTFRRGKFARVARFQIQVGSEVEKLSKSEFARLEKCPVKCPKLNIKVQSLADFFGVISRPIKTSGPFWFRGHARVEWSLTPSALRYRTRTEREQALDLITEFKRVTEIKIDRPPRPDEELMWVQLARHYGLPTRLLDWTESATVALFFACERPESDGLVFTLNPFDLNRRSYPRMPRILDARLDSQVIAPFLRLSGRRMRGGRNPVAINPVWNSDRLMLQKGVFTLHGSRFSLDEGNVSSLVAFPILHESKSRLRTELERVGVDEMTIFPELEHSCKQMIRRAGLESPE